jgi:hypothetical protein
MSRTFYEFNKAQIIERFGERGAPLGIIKQHIICDPRDKRRRLREALGLQFRRESVISYDRSRCWTLGVGFRSPTGS